MSWWLKAQQLIGSIPALIKQRPQRLALFAILTLLVFFYSFPYKQSKGLPGYSAIVPRHQTCFANHLEQHLETLSEPPLRVEENQLLPLVGNGIVLAVIDQPMLHLLPGHNAMELLTVPWHNRVSVAASALHQETLVEVASGALAQLTEYQTRSGSCLLVEARYFALRRSSDVFVQQLHLHNAGPVLQHAVLETALVTDDVTETRLSLPNNIPNADKVRASLHHTGTPSPVLQIHTLPPLNLTLSGESRRVLTMVTSIQTLSPSQATALLDATLDDRVTLLLARTVDRVVKLAQAHSEVFERHEALHHSLFFSHLQATGETPTTKRLALALKASLYYITAALEVADLAQDETESLHDRLTAGSSKGCYDNRPKYTSPRWQMPHSIKDVLSWRHSWLHELAEHGCEALLRPNGKQRSVEAAQAMMRSVVGLTGRANAYRIAPAWLVPEGLSVQLYQVDFDRNLFNLKLTHEGLSLTRADRLRESLTVKVGRHVQRLGAHAHVELPPQTVYIGADTASIEAAFTKHESDKMFGHAPPTHRFSVGLVVLLSIAVFAFHIVLGRMVYQEFCQAKQSN
eukprot:m.79548 g.79548  ORF g.79548 m.79548 type:complete len:573 (-) comp14517_c0_seq2:25-1743(-)